MHIEISENYRRFVNVLSRALTPCAIRATYFPGTAGQGGGGPPS
jgi:hypothetical protein